MTTVEAAHTSIYKRLRAQWDPADAQLLVENVASEPPKDTSKPWIRFGVQLISNVQDTLGGVGNSLMRHVGIITAQVFTPRNRGVIEAHALGAKLKAIFQNKEFEGVRCYATTPRVIGVDGVWFQVNVDTEFDFDEVG